MKWAILLASLGFLVWAAAPVSFWLLGILVAHTLFRNRADALAQGRAYGRPGLFRILLEVTLRALSRSSAWVALGVGLICVMQAALWLASKNIDPNQVLAFEEALSAAHQKLAEALDFKVLLAVMAAMLCCTLLAPHALFVPRLVRLRAALTNVSFALLGATSFTFFGAMELQRMDPEWRSAERWKARASLQNIERAARDLTAIAWIDAEIRRLDTGGKTEFQQLFERTRATAYPNQIVRAIASELGQKAPQVSPRRIPAEDGLVSARVRSYVQADRIALEQRPWDQPSLAELRNANRQLSARELKVNAARTAAIELVSEGLASIAPKAERALINAFVEELASSLSKGALKHILPTRVADLASAKAWGSSYIFGNAALAEGHVTGKWNFNPSSLELRTTGGGIRASEAALLALVQRHNMNQVLARQQALSRPHYGGGTTVHTPTVRSGGSGARVRFRF